MTDLVPQQQFVNPATGEALSLASPIEDLARFLADLREYESQLREVKRAVSHELLGRMDKRGKYTLPLPGGIKIGGTSNKKVEEWDGADLRTALLALVDQGVLDIEAVDDAVETNVEYKVKKSGVNQLRRIGGVVAETVDALAVVKEPDRRVTVTR